MKMGEENKLDFLKSGEVIESSSMYILEPAIPKFELGMSYLIKLGGDCMLKFKKQKDEFVVNILLSKYYFSVLSEVVATLQSIAMDCLSENDSFLNRSFFTFKSKEDGNESLYTFSIVNDQLNHWIDLITKYGDSTVLLAPILLPTKEKKQPSENNNVFIGKRLNLDHNEDLIISPKSLSARAEWGANRPPVEYKSPGSPFKKSSKGKDENIDNNRNRRTVLGNTRNKKPSNHKVEHPLPQDEVKLDHSNDKEELPALTASFSSIIKEKDFIMPPLPPSPISPPSIKKTSHSYNPLKYVKNEVQPITTPLSVSLNPPERDPSSHVFKRGITYKGRKSVSKIKFAPIRPTVEWDTLLLSKSPCDWGINGLEDFVTVPFVNITSEEIKLHRVPLNLHEEKYILSTDIIFDELSTPFETTEREEQSISSTDYFEFHKPEKTLREVVSSWRKSGTPIGQKYLLNTIKELVKSPEKIQ